MNLIVGPLDVCRSPTSSPSRWLHAFGVIINTAYSAQSRSYFRESCRLDIHNRLLRSLACDQDRHFKLTMVSTDIHSQISNLLDHTLGKGTKLEKSANYTPSLSTIDIIANAPGLLT